MLFPLRDIRKNPRSMNERVPQAMAQFVLKIEKLSHIILEMARAYGLRPRLWLLLLFIAILLIQHTICIYFTHTFFLTLTLSLLCTATVYHSLFFYKNRIILYSENVKAKYSLFISFFKPLFIIHYSASTPDQVICF